MNKPAVALAVVCLTGCSFFDDGPLDVNHGNKADVIEASIKDVNLQNNNSFDKQSVYFLHNSIEIKPESIPIIEKQSQNLLEDSEQTLILEGHADERGSREYNIGLGEGRAKVVAKIMQARGVRSHQLKMVSYGEEKPTSLEHNDTAWHLNCRVNLIPQRTQK